MFWGVGGGKLGIEPAERVSAVIAGELPASFVCALRDLPEVNVVRCQGTLPEVLSCCRSVAPCVLLADEQVVNAVNTGLLPRLVEDDKQLIRAVVVCDAGTHTLSKLLHAGLSGTLRTDASASDVRRAIQAVAGGELWFPRKVLSHAIRSLLPAAPAAQLTSRQREVFHLIQQGYNNREISETLFISRETVRWHVRSLNSKIGRTERQLANRLIATDEVAPRLEPDGVKVA